MNTEQAAAHRKGIGMIIIAALLWSTGGLFIKWSALNAFQICTLRSIFTVITFMAIFRKEVFHFSPFTLLNGVFYAGILVLFVMATKETTAANAIFLQYTAPIYVLLLEPLLLKTKLRMINVLTIVFCFIGMTLFFVGKLSPGNFHGNMIAIASGVAFAGFLLGMRKNGAKFQAASIFWGNILIVFICSYSLFDGTAITMRELGITAYLGVFQIGIAYAVFTYGLKRVEAIEASLISMIEPVLNPVWVFLGYGEIPSVFAIAGGVLIVTVIGIRTFIVERSR
jgi:drug/metabolite transporter (DMT)-like permease